jgi:beta-carotene hydroxylase
VNLLLNSTKTTVKPSIHELGTDLLDLSLPKVVLTIAQPFVFFFLYWLFAWYELWIPAVICTMGMSFTTYGSTSHDLVHQNLKLPKSFNTLLLSIIELFCFRSGHAYKVCHLYHHKRYPHTDDIEGAASRMSFFRSLLEGVIFQFKLYHWALHNTRTQSEKRLIIAEGGAVIFLIVFCFYSIQYTVAGVLYLGLMIMGSWIIPLITSYAVHTPGHEHELHQTRLFRGRFFSFIAFEHLYHLEHHLYPMVPHKNWPMLAKRLDPFFKREHVKPLELNIAKSLKTALNKNHG